LTQIWVPWRENPQRYQPRGLKGMAWAPLLAARALFRRFPGTIFWGGVVAVCIVVALHGAVFDFVYERLLVGEWVAPGSERSAFGGPLSLGEIRAALAAPGVQLPAWLAYPLYPLTHRLVRDIVAMLGIIGIVSVIPLFSIWWERKVSAHIQNRVGPMRAGGWHGFTQTVADGIKLITKEDLIPPQGDGLLFRLAPYLTFVPSIMAFIALPFGTYWVFRDTDVGLVFVLAMLGVEVVGVILAGWSSNNKWSVYGSMREACQMVSYEIPMGMALMLPIIAAGTLNLSRVGDQQAGGWFSWMCFQNPFLLATSVAYYVASLASCKRAPFDLAESESELVAGFLTEYSGFRWSMFFFAEYCAMFVVSGLSVILFFGAWYTPWSGAWVNHVLTDVLKLSDGWLKTMVLGVLNDGPLWFILKCGLLLYVQMWVRWTLPRIRIDQLLYACVQVILPLMLLLMLGHVLWVMAVPPDGMLAAVTRYVLGTAGLIFVAGFLRMIAVGWLRRRQLVGYLAADVLPGA
jgi:NADH-quinone oxidoreductase subunit H